MVRGGDVCENKKLEKNLIFYVTGKSGAIFTYQAGYFITDEILIDTMETLALYVDDPIQHIEERRFKPREIVHGDIANQRRYAGASFILSVPIIGQVPVRIGLIC